MVKIDAEIFNAGIFVDKRNVFGPKIVENDYNNVDIILFNHNL